MNMNTTDTVTGNRDVQKEMERAIAAAQGGDKATAHQIFQSLAARNAHLPELWVWLGGTSASLDEAEAAFQRAAMLDPSNEEANLGLRWVGLRRQVLGRAGSADLSTGSFDSSDIMTKSLASGSLNSTSLGTGGLNSGSLNSADVDKAMKMKVGKAGARRMNIPLAAILLFALSLILYGIVFYFLVLAPK